MITETISPSSEDDDEDPFAFSFRDPNWKSKPSNWKIKKNLDAEGNKIRQPRYKQSQSLLPNKCLSFIQNDIEEAMVDPINTKMKQIFIAPDMNASMMNRYFRQTNTPGHTLISIFEDGIRGRGAKAKRNIHQQSSTNNDFICLFSFDLSDVPPPIHDSAYVYQFGPKNKNLYSFVSDYNNGFQIGPLLNDPLDDNKVNCGIKLVWYKKKRVAAVFAKNYINKNEQCFLGYGADYWQNILLCFEIPEQVRVLIQSSL